jgi:hypothetical protein
MRIAKLQIRHHQTFREKVKLKINIKFIIFLSFFEGHFNLDGRGIRLEIRKHSTAI